MQEHQDNLLKIATGDEVEYVASGARKSKEPKRGRVLAVDNVRARRRLLVNRNGQSSWIDTCNVTQVIPQALLKTGAAS